MRGAHLLLVEDDPRLANLVALFLRDEGFVVSVEARGDRVAARLAAEPFDLLLLDVMLPGMSGFDVCKQVRPRFDGPIVMLTAKSEEIDEVLGLELGADDYVAKPVRPRALLARIRKLLGRRTRQPAHTVGALRIDPARREATLAGAPLDLTALEFDLLFHLARQAGRIASREALHREVRGVDYDGLDRSIDLMVSRLRRKLGDGDLIKTVRGAGYLLVVPG